MKLSGYLALFLLIAKAWASILAIDFGLEYSKAAMIAPGVSFDLILTDDSKRKHQSGVAILANDGDIERKFNSHAFSACTRTPQSCFFDLKTLLGRQIDDPEVTRFEKNHPALKVVESKNQRRTVAFTVGDETYSVEEVLGMVFEEIKKQAEANWDQSIGGSGNTISDVVISVPGYLGQAQRTALIDSAEIAGLNVVALIDDGLAVALNYASTREFPEKQYHVIYDMGAGSTKATLVSFAQENGTLKIENEGYGFDESFGGSLLTQSLKEIIEDKFLAQQKKLKSSALAADSRANNRLWQAAEKAKLVLSANTETKVSVESLINDIDLKVTVSRDEFEEYVTQHMDRVIAPLTKAAGTANVDSVILAGGSTRVPFVQKHLVKYLGTDDLLSKNVNADEAAVFGALLGGVSISGKFRTKPIELVQRTTRNYELNAGSQETVVFSENEPSGSVSVALSGLKDTFGDLEIDFLEDGVLYSQYKFKNDLNSTVCPNGVEYYANCSLSTGKVFSLNSVEALCPGEEPVNKSLTARPTHVSYKPLGAASKYQSALKLKSLTNKDKQKLQREELINTLEASLYDLRAYVENDEVVANGPPSMVKNAKELVSELLEWLEAVPKETTTKEIQDKHDEVRVAKIKIQTYVSLGDRLLSLEEFSRLKEKALETMYNLQDFMLTMSEDAFAMKANYTELGLDFEDANKRIKIKVPEIDEQELQGRMKRISDFCGVVEHFETHEGEIETKEKEVLYELREKVLEELKEVQSTYKTLKQVHDKRIKGLKERLRRAKKKQEEKAATQPVSSETSQQPVSSSLHDEL
ncbi:hypothetical protein OGAPHI_004065 [Ogataea philodendri]|uniref:Uncharacterized protein n=1 Tax=Ogataea philodendri TaxID=1378263 RepID=A0A9P8P6B6_9ASCO|nr:uncharacterized protein OGAPHI_004065 [Ogataea philodendri]KAH3665876.1 hypothetical protein OGAPHI_004065 [Ogataea philodendri]